MRASHVFRTVETHTGGNPTRTIVHGVPRLAGDTMMAKLADFRERFDWIRGALMFEPRGHDGMAGCVLTEPCDPRADVGVLFMENAGYVTMCGHSTIGLCTALVETGVIAGAGPHTPILLDTPGGVVSASVAVTDGAVDSVCFRNAPSFAVQLDLPVDTAEHGRLKVDVAYGGNFYAIVDAGSVGLTLDRAHVADAVDLGSRLLPQVQKAASVCHPLLPGLDTVTHIMFVAPDPAIARGGRSLVVFPPKTADPSPCGTGTCARAAAAVARGDARVGDSIVYESVTGARFEARVAQAAPLGSTPAWIVELTGTAYVMAQATYTLDPRDPLRHGFHVR
jgi:proline racemase